MTIQEIKQAVNNGKTVNYKQSNYRVEKDSNNKYYIRCLLNDNFIGLTNLGGDKLNGNAKDFYVS